jgi:hypothetical protein
MLSFIMVDRVVVIESSGGGEGICKNRARNYLSFKKTSKAT